MKKYLIFLLIISVFYSCKNDKSNEVVNEESSQQVADDTKLMSGSFTYYADAAVFQTNNELFGVVENENLMDLIVQSETLKDEATDEVKVTLKVKVTKKPENEEGWENRIDIVEIIKVSKANPGENTIIKLGKEKNAENQ